tara:strand:- start:1083 stop:1967 length:885 start_codon:yes stop_codon:yes gene_type:complete
MFTVTLLTDPSAPTLDATTVEALRNGWGGGAAKWLARGVAAEFDLPERPDNFWQIWEDMQTRAIDVVIQPSDDRRRKMLLADMDSTMIGQECIDELAAEAGVGEKVAGITARAMNGELDFDGALTERVGLLADLDEAVIARVLAERITYTAGGDVLIATMRAQGGHAALVSGGFTAFTSHVAAHLGFDEHRANTLGIENGRLTGRVVLPILGREAKIAALHEITERLGLSPRDVIAVGDGANDLGMLGIAGTGVALHAKPSVQKECDIRINHGDLTALLYIQGYAADDFAAPAR